MLNWQKYLLITLSIFSLVGVIKGFLECKNKKNAYGKTELFSLIGAFAWGDVVILGIFWFLISLVILFLRNWILFLVILSLFWVVRSLGETIFWFNQQFSNKILYPPEKLRFYKVFRNDSVWFIYQIIWQCVTVVSLLFLIYFTTVWLGTN